jgi:hypothetical protein
MERMKKGKKNGSLKGKEIQGDEEVSVFCAPLSHQIPWQRFRSHNTRALLANANSFASARLKAKAAPALAPAQRPAANNSRGFSPLPVKWNRMQQNRIEKNRIRADGLRRTPKNTFT